MKIMKQRIKSVYFKKLKGLRDVEFDLDNDLIAIMGINGACKTTVLHALACVYKPHDESGQNYKFSNFFPPNPDATWADSKLEIKYSEDDNSDKIKEYSKKVDRWSPRYDSRPARNVYYIGIESCLPEIEVQKKTSFIKYRTEEMDDRLSNRLVKQAAYILNKEYETLTLHTMAKKSMSGVKTTTGLIYSSLSMGTGEQRVIKILQTIYNATPYSMVLIDEIDLLLHISALKKLIQVIYDESINKKLQVIFTTHSLVMNELLDFVSIRYIEQNKQKTLLYDYINTDSIYSITGEQQRPIIIYVEDNLSQAIVNHLTKSLNIRSKVQVHLFGSAGNGITLAASFVLNNRDCTNTLIILDGDVYRDDEEKLKQIENRLSGTEMDIKERQEKALSYILQYTLPENVKPEKYIHEMLIELPMEENEIIRMANEIRTQNESHKYITDIVKRIDDNYDVVIKDIIDFASKSEYWAPYISNVKKWLEEHIDV